MLATCNKCGAEGEGDTFYLSRYTRKDGTRAYLQPCKRCCGSRESKRYHAQYVRARKYGITGEDYDRLVAQQGGKCAICGLEPDQRGLFVDHDHDTEAIRGLLCSQCNSMIGMAREDVKTLLKAVDYLQRGAVLLPDPTIKLKRGYWRGGRGARKDASAPRR